MMHEWTDSYDEGVNNQLPIAVDFRIIWIVSMEESSTLTQNLMQTCCSPCSVILNVTATQYTCSLNGLYHPHWLVQWSHHCSHMRIPVHSPWLPGFIDVTQTILVIINNGWTFPRQTWYTHKSNERLLYYICIRYIYTAALWERLPKRCNWDQGRCLWRNDI